MKTLYEKAKKFQWVEVTTTNGNVRNLLAELEHDPISHTILRLHSEGFKEKEIAQMIGIRRQHVNNTLNSCEVKRMSLT